jgi:DNA-binding HxlR family transcriptional regulator
MWRMQRSDFGDQPCSIARTLDIIGDRWTPLVLRDIALGISRFDVIQRDLGLSRKVLTQRLQHLIEHEVIARTPYQDNPVRYDYTLTEKGNDLAMVLVAFQMFGDKWIFGDGGQPMQWRHLDCGEVSGVIPCCENCGKQVGPGDAIPLRGPSFAEGQAPELAAAIDRLAAAFG